MFILETASADGQGGAGVFMPILIALLASGGVAALVAWILSMGWWKDAKKKYAWLELVEKVARMGIAAAEAWAERKSAEGGQKVAGSEKLNQAVLTTKEILKSQNAPAGTLSDELLKATIERQLDKIKAGQA